MNDIPEWTLGWRMHRALEHGGVSIQQMADELEVSRTTVSNWIHDRHPPRAIYVREWALRTGVSLAWLRFGHDDRAGVERLAAAQATAAAS